MHTLQPLQNMSGSSEKSELAVISDESKILQHSYLGSNFL